MSEQLKQFRDQIDAIDLQILNLVSNRAKLAQQIGHAKGGSVVLRPEREAQVIRRLQEHNAGPLSNEAVAQLFIEVMSQCRALEAPMSVAFLGPQGTFTEAAAQKRFGSAILKQAAATIDEVFHLVETGNAQYGVVPVENSTEGAVGRTLDLLMHTPLQICGEVMLSIHQNLLSLQENLIDIRTVYSHPQSFGQCQNWLNKYLAHATRIQVSSNAEAARMASNNPNSAAIAGKQASEVFNLPVKVANIEDDSKNTTRFLVIADQQVAPSGLDKTSIVISAANRPGAVHDLLAPLKKYDVSMSKLESRPAKAELWEYVFYIDLEGHQQDENVAAALKELHEVAAFMKVLGSYPVAG